MGGRISQYMGIQSARTLIDIDKVYQAAELGEFWYKL
jgi:hypothetical protein